MSEFHYLIGVRDSWGKREIDFVIWWDSKIAEGIDLLKAMSNANKLWPKADQEIRRAGISENCKKIEQVTASISAASMRMRYNNNIRAYKYVSKTELDNDFWNTWVKITPIEKLEEARVTI